MKQRFILIGSSFSETKHSPARTRILQYNIKSQLPDIAAAIARQQQQPQLTAEYQQQLLHYFIYKYAKDVSLRTLQRWMKDGKYFKEKETILNINISNSNTSIEFCKKLIILIENILKYEDIAIIDLNNNDNNTQFVENVLLFEKEYQVLKNERKNYTLTNEKDFINVLCKYYILQCDFVKDLRNNEEARNVFIPFIKKMDTFVKKINKQFDRDGEDEYDFDIASQREDGGLPIQMELSELFEQVSRFVNEINDNMNENEKETLLNMYNDWIIQFVMYYKDNILFSTILALCKTLKVCIL